jgi:hypothetical protein
MDRADAPIHSPPRIWSAGYSAGLYPQARQVGKATTWCANCRRPALQRSTAEVLSAIHEHDFLSCSFGGRLRLGKFGLTLEPTKTKLVEVN